jgi:uncharacterized membrane protein
MRNKKREKRPAPQLYWSKSDVLLQVIAFLGVVTSGVLLAVRWPGLPDIVPRHFGVTGQPDAWGSKVSLLQLPIVTFVLYVLLTVLERFPNSFNYPWRITPENAQTQYRIARKLLISVKALMVWTFFFILWRTLEAALGVRGGLGPWFVPLIVGATAALIAYFMYRGARAR